MADSPRRRYSRSPSPYRGRSRSQSSARFHSRSPLPDPRPQERSRSRSHEREADAVNRGNTLYVTGLSSRVTERDLKDHFSKEGRVVSCHVVVEPHTHVSRGFAFVTMDTVEDADRCSKYLNHSVLEGRHITVEKSRRGRPRTPTPGSYLGHRYDRGDRRRYRRGQGHDEYGSSRRRSPLMYSSYKGGRDYSPYRDDRDYYYNRGGREYSPPRSPYGGRARRERSRSLQYSPYRIPDRGYGRRTNGYDR